MLARGHSLPSNPLELAQGVSCDHEFCDIGKLWCVVSAQVREPNRSC